MRETHIGHEGLSTKPTAVEEFLSRASSSALRQLFHDKGFPIDAIREFINTSHFDLNVLESAFALMRGGLSDGDLDGKDIARNTVRGASLPGITLKKHQSYTGSPAQNSSIDHVQATNGSHRYGNGTNTELTFQTGMMGNIEKTPETEELRQTPIVLLGAGPATLMTTTMLRVLGFENIQIIDRSGKFNGIWNIDGVKNASKNNPKDISFQVGLQKATLGNAQVPGGASFHSGEKVVDFLEAVQGILQKETPEPKEG